MIAEEKLLPLLKTHFGFDSFLPNQEVIIREVISGKDVLSIMPTGGGKSLCFQLPALALEGTTIVVSPLIALMKDQVDALKANGIAAAYYNSSQDYAVNKDILRQLAAGELRMFYIAPESLMTLLSTLKNCNICLFAVDEAHCISAWGHDFRPTYAQLNVLKTEFPEVPILALTATADAATQNDILQQLKIPDASTHVASFDRKNLYLDVRPVNNRKKQILEFLKHHPGESGIIYCLSRKSTEDLAGFLCEKGYVARAYHAGLETAQRNSVQEDFINDRTPIIVATIAFGMGIDKSNVRWVLHYNLPKNLESYYQEIGRGGRDGLPSHSLLLYTSSDVYNLRKFINKESEDTVPLAKLERIQQYAEARSCRRIALLSYFGEHTTGSCGNCDVCKNPPLYFDGTQLAKQICETVALVKEKEVLGTVIDILRGSRNAVVLGKNYQELRTYGSLKNLSWHELHQYGKQLVNLGLLTVQYHQMGRLRLSSIGKEVLSTSLKVNLAKPQVHEPGKTREKIESYSKGTLFERLRKLRMAIAVEEKMPAYIIFSDASLKDMEEKVPLSEDAFASIKGVGELKRNKYATRFVQEIIKHQTSKTPAYKKTVEMYLQGLSPEEIGVQRALNPETVYGHLLKAHSLGEAINIASFISPEEIEQIKQAGTELQTPEGLKSYYDHLEGKLPYWKIKYGLYALEKTRSTIVEQKEIMDIGQVEQH